jgi:hypothetical protein
VVVNEGYPSHSVGFTTFTTVPVRRPELGTTTPPTHPQMRANKPRETREKSSIVFFMMLA